MRSALRHLSLTGTPAGNPVIPGDHPDPTILQVVRGEQAEFWASATSGEWSPQFPLFRSTDMVAWTPSGAIFPIQPIWAEGNFWAPELVEDCGRFFVYYVARARDTGTLSLAVATAPHPAGPWLDHGPIHSEPLGAIDPAFARDEHDQPFLIWKTDGNSDKQPTPIWAQPLTPDLLQLTGSRTELITNDQPWEGEVVEGPYILRHGRRFFLFYAGNTCCGRECKYAEGVARADRLLGPWTKFPGNPLVDANDTWRCPGHGTAVHRSGMHGKKGQDYLLYHAYPTEGTVFVGREAILDEIRWSADGWPIINAGKGPHGSSATPPVRFTDTFSGPVLDPSWQWPVNTIPAVLTGTATYPDGALHMWIPGDRQSATLAIPAPGNPRYSASVCLRPEASAAKMPKTRQPVTPTYNPPPSTAWAGLMLIGDPFNTIGLGLRENTLELWYRRGSGEHIAWSEAFDTTPDSLWLRTHAAGDGHFLFEYSFDHETWSPVGIVDASPLPAWDRGLRLALTLEGPPHSCATFQRFELNTR